MCFNGPHLGLVTAFWTKKYSVLTGFYWFALARGYAKKSPLPSNVPKLTAPAFVPHIYTQHELKRLLDCVPAACDGVNVAVEPDVFRTLLLLLYGAGLRLGEALSLKVAGVDLDQAVLCVRESKFYKTRLVPVGSDLTFVLAQYVGGRGVGYLDLPDAPFLRLRNGNKVSHSVAQSAFRRLRSLRRPDLRDSVTTPILIRRDPWRGRVALFRAQRSCAGRFWGRRSVFD